MPLHYQCLDADCGHIIVAADQAALVAAVQEHMSGAHDSFELEDVIVDASTEASSKEVVSTEASSKEVVSTEASSKEVASTEASSKEVASTEASEQRDEETEAKDG